MRPVRSACVLLTLGAGLAATGARPENPPSFDFYAGRAYFEQPVPYQRVPEGLKDITAESCGACHVEIYQEWKSSTHAHAWVDPQFQAEMAKTPGVGWLCLGCHTPLLNQQPEYVTDLDGGRIDKPAKRPNALFDAKFRNEGVGCATCHVRGGAILGPYGSPNAPHPVRLEPKLRGAETCLRCHQATHTYKAQSLTCVFRTGEEWMAGPYPSEGKTCQGCHMPEVSRAIAPEAPVRAGRRHGLGGSGIPKLPGERAAEFPDGLVLSAPKDFATRTPTSVDVRLEIENANAGHRLPTGDPERFITIDLALKDAKGRVLASGQHWIGSKYEWWPETKLLQDNRLAPRERRNVAVRYEGAAPPGPLTLEVVATKHRMTEENARYHGLLGQYPLSRVFFEKTYRIP